MPNESAPVCACGVVVDLQKSRNSSLSARKLTILIPKSSKATKSEDKRSKKHQQQQLQHQQLQHQLQHQLQQQLQHQHQQQEDGRGPKNRTSETGSSSSVTDYSRPSTKSSKQEKRLNHSRRTRSADRTESHYTYIDSNSSILGGGIRENTIPEALYATIPDVPNTSGSETGSCQANAQSRGQPIYAIPSMTSPPPTYDVAIAKTWQSGLPPTYEEYLCHKYAMLSRSHTPPPPWTDSSSASSGIPHSRRDLLASQPELREYLAQLSISHAADHYHSQQQQQQQQQQQTGHMSNQQHSHQQHQQQQVLREQQLRAQTRARAMPPRSQSESRAQQQRIPTMYEDGAFCMETTALQSAFEHGVAFCSLM